MRHAESRSSAPANGTPLLGRILWRVSQPMSRIRESKSGRPGSKRGCTPKPSKTPSPKRTVKSRAIQFLRPTLDFAQSEQICSVIELSPQKLQELCAILDKFALPRAIADFEHHSFVAWNTRFIEQTGFFRTPIK